jgi:hypothetical protein
LCNIYKSPSAQLTPTFPPRRSTDTKRGRGEKDEGKERKEGGILSSEKKEKSPALPRSKPPLFAVAVAVTAKRKDPPPNVSMGAVVFKFPLVIMRWGWR